jgi:hypothetical protein
MGAIELGASHIPPFRRSSSQNEGALAGHSLSDPLAAAAREIEGLSQRAPSVLVNRFFLCIARGYSASSF